MDIYYQTERVEQTVHVARYTSVVDELPVVDLVDELCKSEKRESLRLRVRLLCGYNGLRPKRSLGYRR